MIFQPPMIMFHVNLQGCRWHLVITLVDFWKVTSTLKCSEFFHIWWQLEACDISDLWLLEARFQQQLLCFLSRVHMGKTYKAAVFYNVFFCLGQSHEKGIPKSCPLFFWNICKQRYQRVQSEIYSPANQRLEVELDSLWWDKFEGILTNPHPEMGSNEALEPSLSKEPSNQHFMWWNVPSSELPFSGFNVTFSGVFFVTSIWVIKRALGRSWVKVAFSICSCCQSLLVVYNNLMPQASRILT